MVSYQLFPDQGNYNYIPVMQKFIYQYTVSCLFKLYRINCLQNKTMILSWIYIYQR